MCLLTEVGKTGFHSLLLAYQLDAEKPEVDKGQELVESQWKEPGSLNNAS